MEKNQKVEKMVTNIEKVIVGKREVIELSMISLLAGGHLLLEDVPGVGKTTLAKAIAKTIDCDFKRIQFTPDTLPSDITGQSIYNMSTGKFEFSKGAVMTNIVLADEINRTSPKTQSSLLEAMEEEQVSVDGVTYPLPTPFMVIATQNPIDSLGTFHLPQAQMDRFMMKISIGYPSADKETQMVDMMLHDEKIEDLQPIVNASEMERMKAEVKKIAVKEDVLKYVVEIIQKTRSNLNLTLGASPRATKALVRAAQAYAYINDRSFVMPEDIKFVLPHVLPHRFILSSEGRISGANPKKVLEDIVKEVIIPN